MAWRGQPCASRVTTSDTVSAAVRRRDNAVPFVVVKVLRHAVQMSRFSFCAWMPMVPWPIGPLAGHARWGQNTVAGSMTILLSWLCWGACQEAVGLDPRFLCNLTLPRLSVELPPYSHTFSTPYGTKLLHRSSADL